MWVYYILVYNICDLVLLLQLGDHDNDGGFLLPRHVPEVVHRVHHGTLRSDEHLAFATVTLRREDRFLVFMTTLITELSQILTFQPFCGPSV